MKKAALVLTVLVSVFTFANAQKIGVRAGLNLSNITESESGASTSFTASTGVNAAVFLEGHLASQFYLQPEIGFSQMGAQTSVSINGVSSQAKQKTNYIVVPVLLKFKVPTTGLAIYAGPQFSILLSANSTSAGVSQGDASEYKFADFSGVAGLEYFFGFGLGVSARYQAGITNVASDAVTYSAKNKAFTFSLEYKL